jgi:hypothetical protein
LALTWCSLANSQGHAWCSFSLASAIPLFADLWGHF